MTPSDINTASRDLYNATGDSYFTDAQIFNWIWQGCHEFAKEAWLIERLYSTSTVAAQQSYTYPTNTIAIKRLTVNGRKLKRITHRYDDAITLSNATVTTQGWPIYYTDWNYTFSLRPIPDSVYTMNLYAYKDADQVTATSVLEIPSMFHFDLVDHVLFRMFQKDKNTDMVALYGAEWARHVKDAKAYKKRQMRSDSFATVQSEDILPVTIVGEA